MHHLPRFVTGRRKSWGKKKGPKLERLNAMRYTDYEAPPLSNSSPSSTSMEYSYPCSTADLVSEGRSFRIEGAQWEIARMCRSIGLSGPDDFDISTEAWEALKGRGFEEFVQEMGVCGNPNLDYLGETEEQRLVNDLAHRVGASVRICEEAAELSEVKAVGADAYSVSGHARGIRGARPPVLEAPGGMGFPIIDGSSAAWDMRTAFIPEVGRSCSLISQARFSTPNDDCCEDNRAVSERDGVAAAGHGRTDTQCDSYIFSTSNDGDDSSTNSEPTPNVSPGDRFKPIIQGWMKGGLLGRGSYGSVYEGISENGFFFAIKEVSLVDEGSQAKQSVSQLEQEIALLRQFEHENIVQYYGTDKDETNLYIFLELVTRGSLLSLYRTYQLRDSQVSVYTRQILHGLKYLHDRNVVHRDIKCANILVDTSGSVKLADFGLAKATRKNDVKSCKGTPYWMAPEVVNGKKQGYGLAADIWSLGCTVLEMLTRQIPYSHLEWMPAFYCIGHGVLPEIPNDLSDDSRHFILQCLKVNPSDRPTAAQLLEHPFVKRSIQTPIGFPSPFYNRRL
uniref:mitogen-activated protein kinase kinase kinase n=1 Tax=Kalanchoe fedtschenkoi TaxID=63787 RepID=A0A7N0T7L5_KALFE